MFVRRFFHLAIAMAATLPAASTQAALDLIPAPFRGQPGTVLAAWDFQTSNNPQPADLVQFVPLPGAALVPYYPSADFLNMAWFPAGLDGGWYGLPGNVYDLTDGGIINLVLPNFIDQEPIKQIWVQIAYLPGGPSPYVAAIEGSDSEAGLVFGVSNGYVDYTDVGFRVESWVIEPNPDFESIQIFVPMFVFVDSIVVDTISVPEASTLMLCSTAALFAATTWAASRRIRRESAL